MSTTQSKGTALITGASAGIGAVYADRLARRDYDLILVARNHHRLNTLAKTLAEQTGRRIEVVVADLTNNADLARVEKIARENTALAMLVNNAGVGAIKPLLDTDVDKLDELLSLNIRALTRLTYAAAPAFVSRGAGTIINISSVVGIAPEMLNGVYGASKAFVTAFNPCNTSPATFYRRSARCCRRARATPRARSLLDAARHASRAGTGSVPPPRAEGRQRATQGGGPVGAQPGRTYPSRAHMDVRATSRPKVFEKVED